MQTWATSDAQQIESCSDQTWAQTEVDKDAALKDKRFSPAGALQRWFQMCRMSHEVIKLRNNDSSKKTFRSSECASTLHLCTDFKSSMFWSLCAILATCSSTVLSNFPGRCHSVELELFFAFAAIDGG